MYGPKWSFLLMYGSHDMRYTGFPQVNGLSTDPRDLERHILGYNKGPFCIKHLKMSKCLLILSCLCVF